MELNISDQLSQLIAALITGGFMGLLLDFIESIPLRKKVLPAALRLIWLAAAAAAVVLVGRTSGAGMRGFFLLAVLGGICLYRGALSPMVRDDLRRFVQFLH